VAQEYFTDFWIVTHDGRKLFPAKIRNRTTGRSTFRQLDPGTNLTSRNTEFDSVEDAVRAFLAGACIRFGAASEPDDRGFSRDGRLVASYGSTPSFRAANPTFRW